MAEGTFAAAGHTEYEVVVRAHPCPGLFGFRWQVSLRRYYDYPSRGGERRYGHIETYPWLSLFRRWAVRAARGQARYVQGYAGEIAVVEEPWR